MTTSKPFTPGHPPDEVSEAWLLMRSDDGEGGESDAVVLAIRQGGDWHEAADWKAESTLDSVHAEACWIVGWLPYVVPQPVLATTCMKTFKDLIKQLKEEWLWVSGWWEYSGSAITREALSVGLLGLVLCAVLVAVLHFYY